MDGDGEQSRDMVYVEDIAAANIIVGENHRPSMHHKIYNIGTGTRYTNNEILGYFIDKGYDNIGLSPERPGDVRHTEADITRMKEDFNWKAKTNLESGLMKTFEWWEI